jgi:hypothetical protein
MNRNSHSVIASVAKQSILSFRDKMDCFASLAMTAVGGGTAPLHQRRPRERGDPYAVPVEITGSASGLVETSHVDNR